MSRDIVTHTLGTAKFDPPAVPQTFTIRCADCADEAGTHLPDCPGVIAAGYDTGQGAATMRVFPRAGASFGTFNDALAALRFYLMAGPVELRMEDGQVFTMEHVFGSSADRMDSRFRT